MKTPVAALVCALVLASGCGGSDEGAADAPSSIAQTTTAPAETTTAPTTVPATVEVACLDAPDDCSLGELASEAGVLIGAAASSDRLDDPAYAEVLSSEFNSLTAENEMKWAALQPEEGNFDFAGADALVAFAESNDMAVKGHTLVWNQEGLDSTPDWVEAISDPDELRAALRTHFETVLEHFGDSVDRWDVVNEPLQNVGTEPYEGHFAQVLGPDWVDEMFILADEVSPTSRLFLNEAGMELLPAKADAFYELVAGMVDRGVPIDGVGLQAHLLLGAPEENVIGDLVTRFSQLGLDVALTELDIVSDLGSDEDDDPLSMQADAYAQVVGECLAAGCMEVTIWGIDDASTWLTSFLGRDTTDPLLFDAAYLPKPAHEAVRDEIIEFSANG